MKPPDAFTLEKVRQWLAYAEEDLRVARHGFSMPGTPPYRVIAFHAQQCAEKYLKASLVFQGVDFPFTRTVSGGCWTSALPPRLGQSNYGMPKNSARPPSRQDIRARM